MPYYSLTEKKNQSILINNIQNSQQDVNSIHLRCHQGSRPDWPKRWLGKGFIQFNCRQKLGGPDHPHYPLQPVQREQFISLNS